MIITNSLTELQKKCEDATLEEGLEIIDKLEQELKAEPGIGLAANQIGILKKVCIVRVPDQESGEVFGYNFINPEIISRTNPIVFDNEGCLSFPNKFIKTIRYANIKVKDLLEPEGRAFFGLEAVCIQHETDHTLGKTMYDSTPKAIGPNGKCPCASGKKFKKCCMKELMKKKLL